MRLGAKRGPGGRLADCGGFGSGAHDSTLGLVSLVNFIEYANSYGQKNA